MSPGYIQEMKKLEPVSNEMLDAESCRLQKVIYRYRVLHKLRSTKGESVTALWNITLQMGATNATRRGVVKITDMLDMIHGWPLSTIFTRNIGRSKG